jgi:hypothetical protein
MVGHGAKFGHKKEQAIVALLSRKSVEDAARAVGIGTNTLLRWTKDPEFDAAYREARSTAFRQSIARLQDAANAAVTTVLKIMVDSNVSAGTRLRAAEVVLSQAAKANEIEDIESRVAELEHATGSARTPQKRSAILNWPNSMAEADPPPPSAQTSTVPRLPAVARLK